MLEYLNHLGIRYFVLSPGARNSLLLHAVIEKKLQHCCHFDERGAAFFALGYNKAKINRGINQNINRDNQQNLACVITTSGSAIANTYPAVTEAYESETPLFILTADRPKNLHGIRSNQTTNQNNFFANHCLHSVKLDLENPRFSNAAMLKSVQKIFLNLRGPSHINISLSEPFIFDRDLKNLSIFKKNEIIKKYTPKFDKKNQPPSNIQPTLLVLKKIFDELHKKNKDCFFIVGECSLDESKFILKALKHSPYPVFLDITVSNYFLAEKEKNDQFPFVFDYQTFADALENSVHTIIHLGGAFISKSLSIYLKKNPPKNYIHIEAPRRTKKYDPNKVVTKHFCCDYNFLMPHVQLILQKGKKDRQKISASKKITITEKIKIALKKNYKENYKENYEGNYLQALNKNSKTLKLTERLFIFSLLKKSRQSTKTNIFFGNSMPIRIGDIYPKPNGFCSVFSNRGVSGIDGLIATICGAAQSSTTNRNEASKLIGVIGDLSALHDLNSVFFLNNTGLTNTKMINSKLTGIKKSKKNDAIKLRKSSVSLIIINNGEGSIFRHLELFKNFKKTDQAQAILYRHSLKFTDIAKMASLPYRHLKNISDLDSCLNWIFQSGNKILEVKVDAKESMMDYKKYCERAKNIFLEKFKEKSD